MTESWRGGEKLIGIINEIKLLLRRIWGIREREDLGMC